MLQHAGDDKVARECQLDNATVMLFNVETVYRCAMYEISDMATQD